MNEQNDKVCRHAWLTMLQTCLQHLGYDTKIANRASWIVEREGIVSALRELCEDFGDNDWSEDLHLGDVIRRHLGNHLYEKWENEASEDLSSGTFTLGEWRTKE